MNLAVEGQQIRFGDMSSTGVYEQLDLGDLFIDLLHKFHNEVNQLVLQHGLNVNIRDEETDVVPGHRHSA